MKFLFKLCVCNGAHVLHQVLLDYERHITNAGEPDIPIASKSEPKQLKPPKLSRSEPVHVDTQVNIKTSHSIDIS
jgi:hypothetical protein